VTSVGRDLARRECKRIATFRLRGHARADSLTRIRWRHLSAMIYRIIGSGSLLHPRAKRVRANGIIKVEITRYVYFNGSARSRARGNCAEGIIKRICALRPRGI